MEIFIVFTIAITLVVYLHEKFRIKDEQTADLVVSLYLKKQWHKWKGGAQIVVLAMVYYAALLQQQHHFYSIAVTLFAASFFWMFHDGLLNSFLFKKEWWYVGTTGSIDKKFGRSFIAIAKVVTLTVSVLMLIIWKIFF